MQRKSLSSLNLCIQPSHQNNREVFVKITDSSKEALERCERNYNDSSEKSLKLGLTAQEENLLLELLTKLLGHKGE